MRLRVSAAREICIWIGSRRHCSRLSAHGCVQMERKTLGILGNNLGGLISCYAGWTRDVYGKVGCMSYSFWWDANDYPKHVITKGLPSTPFPQIYMDSGHTRWGGKLHHLHNGNFQLPVVRASFRTSRRGSTSNKVGPTMRHPGRNALMSPLGHYILQKPFSC
jgi:hypothetical protein